MKRALLIFAFAFCIFNFAFGEALFVRKDATGSKTGLDWNNAWTDWNEVQWGSGAGKVSAGDTVYIAGGVGTYTSTLTPGASGTSGSWIHIKRVRTTDSAATSAAGWNAAFDAQVVGPAQITFAQLGEWMVFDGAVTNGWKIPVPNGAYYGIGWNETVPVANNLVFSNLDIAGPGGATAFTYASDIRGINFRSYIGPNWREFTNIVVSGCSIHGMPNLIYLVHGVGMTIERNNFYDCWAQNSATYHENVCITLLSTNITWRYNTIRNWAAEGIEMGYAHRGWKIYGNLWVAGAAGPYRRALETQYTPSRDIEVYNNTFIGTWICIYDDNSGGGWINCSLKNNVWYNCLTIGNIGGGWDKDYNAIDASNSETHGLANITSSFFNNYAGGDYTIPSTINSTHGRDKGVALGAPFDFDMFGTQRNENGSTDIGYMEYTTGTPDTTAPVITALSSNSPGYTNVTLTFTVSETSTYWIGYGTTTNLGTYSTNGPGSSASFTINGLTKATTYYWQASAVDVAGNPTNGAILSFATRTDTTNPTINITSGTSSSVTPYALSAVGSDDLAIDHVSWSNAATGGSGTCTGTTSATASIPLAAGNNSITLTIYDSSGNTGTGNITVNYSTGTPTITTVTNFRITGP